jgi:hypothetical protein
MLVTPASASGRTGVAHAIARRPPLGPYIRSAVPFKGYADSAYDSAYP